MNRTALQAVRAADNSSLPLPRYALPRYALSTFDMLVVTSGIGQQNQTCQQLMTKFRSAVRDSKL